MSAERPIPDPEPIEQETEEAVDIEEALQSTTANPRADEHGTRALALDDGAANALAASRRSTVLVLAGGVGSGKTSVYAALYERFGRGPFGGRLFAGSLTLAGFEKRCHGWRVDSGQEIPTIDHTKATDLQWLHMRIRDEERRRPIQDLLFGDYDGEVFDALSGGASEEGDYRFLRRADHVGLNLDGDLLSLDTERDGAVTKATYLADALLEDGRLADPRSLFIVLTKLDLIVTRKQLAPVEVALKSIADLIRSRNGGHEALVVRLAARSETDIFPLGHGLNELLDLLSEQPAVQISNGPPQFSSGDPFCSFIA
jgi:hypothetical protein